MAKNKMRYNIHKNKLRRKVTYVNKWNIQPKGHRTW